MLNYNANYYPFGMTMPNRQSPVIAGDEHRYGYQGSEVDSEIKGEGNSYTTHFRQLDPRIGRWLSYDPKATAWESPYASMGNNPILYNDPLGDSIPTKFLDSKGAKVGEVPDEFQHMMIQNYGLEVGYNSKTEMLYLKNDLGQPKGGSSTARQMLKDALTSDLTGKEAQKEFGNLVVGYKLENPNDWNNRGVVFGLAHTSGIFKHSTKRTAFLDLNDFEFSQSSGTDILKGADYNNVNPRAYDMGRIFEHEYLGHVILGLKDGNEFKPGKNISFVNSLRKEMGLEVRLNYGLLNKGVIIMFDSEEVKSRVLRNRYYMHEKKGLPPVNQYIRIGSTEDTRSTE